MRRPAPALATGARGGRSGGRATFRLTVALAALGLLAPVPAVAKTPDLLAYMQARAADADGAAALAARRYADALAAAPGDTRVAAYAYRQAVAAGDLSLAFSTISALGQAAPPDADLLILASAAVHDDAAAADAAIARIGKGQLAVLSSSLAAWAALAGGRDPLPLLAATRDDPVARRFASETRALILIAQGHVREGMATLRAILGNGQASEDLRIIAARLLVGMNKTAEARTLLVGDAPAIAAMRARPGDGSKPTLGFGVSALLTRVVTDLIAGPPGPLPLAMAQAAVVADPANDRARLLLGYSLGRSGETVRALATLEAVGDNSPYAAAARGGRVQILAGADRMDEALAQAAVLAKSDRADDLQRYADLLASADRPAAAAPLYRRIIDQAGDRAEWSAWMQYGAALDEAGDWPQARRALAEAVRLAPDEPLALNYLGYAQIVHGEPVAPAQAMLEKARRLRPEDAAITDSLGWAYFLSNEPRRALPLIEQAAAASPVDQEVNEHLGDVYWALGRRFDARYAWRAAKVAAEPDEAARLAAKIANGPAPRP
ncbi:tetratricopeptide repeat protein [Sphingomonas dokdonensis]|uniref:Tetratricopeptide repeat protein n=1 Tax=Sphingomonas dokdonensis TaxID=344880 RepID=A0A245ZP59_9SPHN|nr:tetratricopeptide repeat protein [Sphingomonas dokdonensis]OWK31512.1 tetratricopeptide repeat protein [Sphingomonas dokdonensis]